MPPDVAAFIERREACDHFRGEEPYDSERAAELRISVAKACTGTDRELARLKQKYSTNRRVMTRLSRYEDRVE